MINTNILLNISEVIACNISAKQGFVVHRIGVGSVSFSDIRADGGFEAANLSFDVKKLIAKGLVESNQSAEDGRLSILSLTQKGLRTLRRISVKR